MNTFIHSICYSVRTAPSASLPRSHKLRFCPREVASSEPMASPPAPNKGRHPYPIYMPPLRRLRDRSQSSPVFRLRLVGRPARVLLSPSSVLHTGMRAPGIGMLSTRPLEVWALRGWMLTVTAVTQRLRHRWRALGHSATASERELVSPTQVIRTVIS